MKDKFFQYYKLTDEDLTQIWANCTFVFDANVLLNFYRYSENTTTKFIEILNHIKDRVWLPYQVGEEFHRNRLEIIWEQKETYYKLESDLTDFKNKIINTLSNIRHPFITIEPLKSQIQETFSQIAGQLKEGYIKHPDYLEKDPILQTVTNVFNGKVGEFYDAEKLKEIYKDGEERYKNNIPPGYRDSKKDGLAKYGDLIIWYQVIDYAKHNKLPIILVIDDKKEDWWDKLHGLTIGPRNELLREFREKTGQAFYMYQTPQFLSYAQNYLEQQIGTEIIEEVKDIQKQKEVAADSLNSVMFVCGSAYFYIGDQQIPMSVAPYIKDNTFYIPIRFLAYAIGVNPTNVLWDSSQQTLTILKDSTVVQLRIGSDVFLVNGAAIKLSSALDFINNEVMAPVSILAPLYNLAVNWDPANQTLTVWK